MLIKRIFDVKGPAGFVPNGWNWNYSADLWDNNLIVTHEFIEKFNSKYVQVPVYDCNLNLPQDLIHDMHISEIRYDERLGIVEDGTDGDSNFFMTIHPYGSIDTCIGNNLNYHEGTHCFDLISAKAKYYLKNAKNFYLIFDYSSEGDIRNSLFENLHKKCKEMGVSPTKVLVVSAAMNTRSIYEEYLKNNKEVEQFYTGYYCWSLIAKKKETSHLLERGSVFEFNGNANECSIMTETDFLNSTNRKDKCLIYNRRVAPHRVIMLSLLRNDDLLKTAQYSIDLSLWSHGDIGLDLSNGTDYDDVLYIEDKQYKSKVINGFFKLNKIGKSVVDYDNVGGVWGFGFEHKEPYMNTYFSVITETNFYEHGHYISEKSFKGIQHLHPFVILGKPGILKQLKSWGFKTFSDFWDESYDGIQNNSERMIAVYSVVKYLCEKSNEEWDELNKQLYPILEHNRKHLLSMTEEMVSEIYVTNLNKLLENEPNQENYSLL